MNRTPLIANAVLWAAAIITAAAVGAPDILTLILLPTLASASLLVLMPKGKVVACRV
jgi:hypothetical protein